MPDFTARFTAGTSLATWVDAAGNQSRINPASGHVLRYTKGQVGTEIVVKATVGGVEGPSDGTLGGRLFTAAFAEHSAPYPFAPAGDASHSSIQRFTPPAAGHYLLVIRRDDGGAIGMHVDVE